MKPIGGCRGLSEIPGYTLWYGPGGQVRCKADKALETFKQRIREMTLTAVPGGAARRRC